MEIFGIEKIKDRTEATDTYTEEEFLRSLLVPKTTKCKSCGRNPREGEIFGKHKINWGKTSLICPDCYQDMVDFEDECFEKKDKTEGKNDGENSSEHSKI